MPNPKPSQAPIHVLDDDEVEAGQFQDCHDDLSSMSGEPITRDPNDVLQQRYDHLKMEYDELSKKYEVKVQLSGWDEGDDK